MQGTAHFKYKEFRCLCLEKGLSPKNGYCGGKVWVKDKLLNKLEELRSALGDRPIIIGSGCRCYEYNRAKKGAPHSQHILGNAADITVPGIPPKRVADVAEAIGFGGVGRYPTFVHVDVRYDFSRWKETE